MGNTLFNLSVLEIHSQAINLLNVDKMAAVLSFIFPVLIAARGFTDDSKVQSHTVHTMPGCTVTKYMLRKEERRERKRESEEKVSCFHFCNKGLSLLPASVTLLPFRPKGFCVFCVHFVCVLAFARPSLGVCVCVCVCVCVYHYTSSPRLQGNISWIFYKYS